MKSISLSLLIALSFSSCAANTTQLHHIQDELHQVQSAQDALLSQAIPQSGFNTLFQKYSQSKNLKLYKDWENIVNSKDPNVIYFIDTTKLWIKYNLLEKIRFEIREDDFTLLENRVDAILQMGDYNANYSEDEQNSNYVVYQDLNLRVAPIIDKSTKKSILKRGTFVKVHYSISFMQDIEISKWVFITTEFGQNGWVNSAFLSAVEKR